MTQVTKMDKTSFPLHGFILFLHRIKPVTGIAMSGPTSFCGPLVLWESHLPHRYGNQHVRQSPAESHYRNQQQQYCTKQASHFPERGDFNIVFSFAMAAGYEDYVEEFEAM